MPRPPTAGPRATASEPCSRSPRRAASRRSAWPSTAGTPAWRTSRRCAGAAGAGCPQKANRLVSPDGTGNRPLGECSIAATGTRIHRRGYGPIQAFRLVSPDGDTEHWAAGDEQMGELTRLTYAEWAWGIEQYQRGLKHECGGERARVRAARAQRVHIGRATRAFPRFEQHHGVTGVSWWEAKTGILREAVRAYLAAPRCTLASTATA